MYMYLPQNSAMTHFENSKILITNYGICIITMYLTLFICINKLATVKRLINSYHKLISMSSPLKASKQYMPVPPYVHKWLKFTHGYKTAVAVSSFMVATKATNTVRVADYFSNKMNWPLVCVVGYYQDRMKLFTLAQYFRAAFYADMHLHTAIAVRAGLPAMEAIKQFLQSNKIAEDELQLATAYKRWQRQGRTGIPGFKFN